MCPDDGKTYTFEELKKAYSGTTAARACWLRANLVSGPSPAIICKLLIVESPHWGPGLWTKAPARPYCCREESTLLKICKHIGEMPWPRLEQQSTSPRSRRRMRLECRSLVCELICGLHLIFGGWLVNRRTTSRKSGTSHPSALCGHEHVQVALKAWLEMTA